MFLFCTDFVPVVNMVNGSHMQRYSHGSFVLLDYSVPSAVLLTHCGLILARSVLTCGGLVGCSSMC
jgi:hypothetical protein